MYAKVIDQIVVGVMNSLPASHANISGFNTLSDEEALSYGFYPIEELKEPLLCREVDEGEKDSEGAPILRSVPLQAYGASTDRIEESKVVRVYSILDRPIKEVLEEINRPIIKEISLIEAKQGRAVREAALGAPEYLMKIQVQIAALQARIVKE